MSDIQIIDTVDADEVEVGDQILIDGDPVEVTWVGDDPEAPLEGVRITGWSHESGDTVTYDLWFGDRVDLWGV